jgi:EpsI family protein
MTRRDMWRWSPAIILAVGAFFTVGLDTQQATQLRADLAQAMPAAMEGFSSRDVELSPDEIRAAGVTDYLFREFARADAESLQPDSVGSAESFSLYVGYYDSQTQGKTIHSPKNCLPGAGWEALRSRMVTLATAGGPVRANRYLLQRGEQQALVVYWYQGRGRIEANEYVVKANLLRDAALRGRSEEALVRIVVPITTDEESAYRIAVAAAAQFIPSLERALPA